MRILQKPSPNFGKRKAGVKIDMLILHYTGMPSFKHALDRLLDSTTEVSAHYLIDEDGSCYQLVDEEMRAWHAGASYWRGETDINSRSIGIELVNPGHEFGYRPFPDLQMKALAQLAQQIIKKHNIPSHHVLGHSDVAIARKIDPGELFDWQFLAAQNVGLWPDPHPLEESDFDQDEVQYLLETFGYNIENMAETMRAFQRHFYPQNLSGIVDTETVKRLRALVRQAGL